MKSTKIHKKTSFFSLLFAVLLLPFFAVLSAAVLLHVLLTVS
jgi:hypothetical protein